MEVSVISFRAKVLWLCVIIASASAVFFACGRSSVKPSFDIIIKGGKIIDGAGNPWFYGDVGIKADTIVAIGDLEGRTADRIILAGGMAVAPGFIDMHTHCDWGLSSPEARGNFNYLTQGVTTVVTGNCGMSPVSIRETAAQWNKEGVGTNAAILVGLGTVREKVMGSEDRRPSPREMTDMKAMVEKAMEEGAFGVSTGLQYIPGKFATTDEIVELAGVASAFGGMYASHLRSEEEDLIPAVEEAIRIGEQTRLRVEISHLKSSGRPNWGRLKEAVGLVSKARSRGMEVTADIYPYNKSATTTLETIFNLPPDLGPLTAIEAKLEGSDLSAEERKELESRLVGELQKALTDPETRLKIRRLTTKGVPDKVNWVAKGGWENFTIMFSRTNPAFVGRMFSDLARELGRPEFDIAADLYIAEGRDLLISLSAMSEEDVRLGLSQPWTMISSDGESMVQTSEERVHPRNFGTFTRVLAKYVRDEGLLGLEDAVRKMTSLPAQLLRLKDRGIIREGAKADLVVFDPTKVQDRATFLEPRQLSTGIIFVLVNGAFAVENGSYNGALKGRPLLNNGPK